MNMFAIGLLFVLNIFIPQSMLKMAAPMNGIEVSKLRKKRLTTLVDPSARWHVMNWRENPSSCDVFEVFATFRSGASPGILKACSSPTISLVARLAPSVRRRVFLRACSAPHLVWGLSVCVSHNKKVCPSLPFDGFASNPKISFLQHVTQVLINCFIRRAGSSYGGGGGCRRRSGVIIRGHCWAIRIEEIS